MRKPPLLTGETVVRHRVVAALLPNKCARSRLVTGGLDRWDWLG